MTYRKLAGGKLEVSVIALGCWQFAGGDMWGAQKDSDSIDAVSAALDEGITLFDTAEAYGSGKSEEVLGEALEGRRARAVIATKTAGPTYGPEEIQAACERSLKRLKTDYIDIYQLHWPRENQAPAEQIFEGVSKLKQQGKIRHFGVCNFGQQNLGDLLQAGAVASNQLNYSLLWRGIEYDIVPKCRDEGIGILTYGSLMHGLLSGRYETLDDFPTSRGRTLHFASTRPDVLHGQPGQEQLTTETLRRIKSLCSDAGFSMVEAAFGWVARQPQVTSVLAGARKSEQVRQNARVASRTLPGAFLSALSKASEDLKKAFGGQADVWDLPGRIR